MVDNFFTLLRETLDASDAVDNFDLNNDSGSIEKFKKLTVEQYNTVSKLIEFIKLNEAYILESIK